VASHQRTHRATVFMDTSGLIALTSRKDRHHAHAAQQEIALQATKAHFAISTLVLTEYANAMSRQRL
jgi:predicted nucleic acid-binding protein